MTGRPRPRSCPTLRLGRGLLWCLLAGTAAPLHAAPCIADQPPNEQPASGQSVPTEFCLAGAAGQHYYLWRVPDSYAGRQWHIRLESLPGENTILMVQSVDHDPRQPGPLNLQTLWHGKSSATSANLATEALLLAPGLYGIVAATQQPPGLFRLYVTADAAPAPSPGAALTAPKPGSAPTPAQVPTPGQVATPAPPPTPTVAPANAPVSAPQPTAAQPPVLERTATGGATETIVPWTIDTAASATRWTINLQTTAGSEPRLRLSGPDGKELTLDTGRTDKAGRLHFPQLGLPPGAYKIAINAKPGAPLKLSITADGPRDSTHISQPDVAPKFAFTFKPGAPLSGVFVEKGGVTDKQYVALTLDDTWKDKRFDLVLRALPNSRPERLQLGYLTSAEQDANVRGGPGEVRLDNLTLPPGRHVFSLLTSGGVSEDMPFSLTIENVSARVPGQEQEPNDIAELANAVPPDGVIAGESNGDSDTDYFRLNVSGPQQLWKLDCECAGVDWLTVRGGNGDDIISVNQFPNGTLHLSSLLLARGDHIFRVRSTGAHYKLHFAPQGPAPVEAGGHPAPLDAPLSSADEIEPNDDPSLAMPLALNSSRAGMNDHGGDKDYYRFTLLGRTHIRLTLADSGAAGRHATLGWGADQRPLANLATSPTQQSVFWDGVLGAGDYYVMIRADSVDSSVYRIRLEPRNPFINTDTAPPPAIEATLTLAQKTVAAFSPYAQSITGQVTLVSKAAEPADLTVTAYAGDERWHLTTAPSVHLDAGKSVSLPVTVRVAPEARAGYPVQLGVGFRDHGGAQIAALTTLAADESAPELSPSLAPRIPTALAGGFNIAWSALGATSKDGHPELIDGLYNAGGTLKLPAQDAKTPLTIALAPASATRIAGFGFIPADDSVPAGDRLRHFKVSLSTDGTQFTEALNSALPSRTEWQYFVLPQPIAARFARLELLDAQDPKATTIALAEFQVIADPATTVFPPPGLEVGTLLRGGHVVWMDPYPAVSAFTANDAQAMFSNAATRSLTDLWSTNRKEPLSWTIGFLDDRPASIDSLVWTYPNDEAAGGAIPAVEVFGSSSSPRGPWTDLGQWHIAPRGESAPFKLNGQPTLRYLRFLARATKYGNSADFPLHLSVREAPASGSYRSVLALPVDTLPPPTNPPAALGSTSEPRVLPQNKPVTGVARLGSHVDRWLLSQPAGAHGITLELSHAPAIGAVLTLQGADGHQVALEESTADAAVHRYKTALAPGNYTVTVSEPPHTLALSWDTSDSVSGWLPAITSAVRSVTQDAVPGREELNLFPFHDPIAEPLLKEYSGDPAALLGALQAYNWKDTSSSAEAALIGASESLRERRGRRGIILLTDAETSSISMTPQLWQTLDATGAQIFALSVPTHSKGEDSWKSRNLMTDWAAASGGFTANLGDQGDVEAAFQRAAAALRTGAPYTLTAIAAAAPPGPGKLTVTFAALKPGARAAAPQPTVALLLDASGSMLQKIKGQQKIEIARTELNHLVSEVIPEGTQVTLRVYGQGGKGSCRSDLMMPLAPIDRAKARAVIATVRSTDGAKTATAASLHATAQDLAKATGAKRVILVTDGEENCGGNVESEIAALHSSGFDVQLDIVGFAIESPQAGKMFQHWAQLGGGQYFESRDAPTLDTAMKRALRQTFEVIDSQNAVVAGGDVGGPPLELPAGDYRVRLHGQSSQPVPATVTTGTVTNITLQN